MKQYILDFDKKMARAVGVLPKQLIEPMTWLGRFTTPALWVCYVLTVDYLVVSPGEIVPGTFVAIVLMPLASVVKLFIKRKRPPTVYAQSMRIKSYSFPSSHAYTAALSLGFIALSFNPTTVLWWGVSALGVIVIGLSRVFIGAHYPSDVVMGWLLGLAALGLSLSFTGVS